MGEVIFPTKNFLKFGPFFPINICGTLFGRGVRDEEKVESGLETEPLYKFSVLALARKLMGRENARRRKWE